LERKERKQGKKRSGDDRREDEKTED